MTVENGEIDFAAGVALTGITWDGAAELPTMNYELEVEARRIEGYDFFAGITFPVRDSHCSFIVGGWGGGVVGLSSIDGLDASENSSSSFRTFERHRWHRLRVRVSEVKDGNGETDQKIECWIDDEQVIDEIVTEREISTRVEVDLSKPLGVAAWQTRAGIRAIRLRRL